MSVADRSLLEIKIRDLKDAQSAVSMQTTCFSGLIIDMLDTRIKQVTAVQEADRLATPPVEEIDVIALDRALTQARAAGVSSDVLQPWQVQQQRAAAAQREAIHAQLGDQVARLAAPSLLEVQTVPLMNALSQARAAGVHSELVLPFESKLREAAVAQAQVVNPDVLALKVDEMGTKLQLARDLGGTREQLVDAEAAHRQAAAAQTSTHLAGEALLEVKCAELERALEAARETDVPPHILYPCDERWREAAQAQLLNLIGVKFAISIDASQLEKALEQASRSGVAQDVVARGRAKLEEAKSLQEGHQKYRGANPAMPAANSKQAEATSKVKPMPREAKKGGPAPPARGPF